MKAISFADSRGCLRLAVTDPPGAWRDVTIAALDGASPRTGFSPMRHFLSRQGSWAELAAAVHAYQLERPSPLTRAIMKKVFAIMVTIGERIAPDPRITFPEEQRRQAARTGMDKSPLNNASTTSATPPGRAPKHTEQPNRC